jgi:DNA-binding SARP family transcriptional activator
MTIASHRRSDLPPGPSTGQAGTTRLELVNGPRLIDAGATVPIPEGSKQLLALVALEAGPVDRRDAAERLWPDADLSRAGGNLRSALWRLRRAGVDVVTAESTWIGLRPDVRVDVDWWQGWADRLGRGLSDDDTLRIPAGYIEVLNLLPGWYDDWVIVQREAIRHRVLHALETLSRHLSARGRHAEAVEAAMTAVCADPFRESAQRALIATHLQEGNRIEAERALRSYAELLRLELGVTPSAELVAACRGG